MSNICLLVLIGIPGSGKSSLCKYIQRNSNNLYNIIHVKYDRYDTSPTYKHFRCSILEKVEMMLHGISKENKNTKWLLLIDDNMYYRSMRRDYYNFARKFQTGFCQIYLNCTKEVALQRNRKRSDDFVPEDVICNILEKIEVPSSLAWEKYTIEINSNEHFTSECISNIWREIEAATGDFPSMRTAPSPQQPNELHNLDLMIRKIVHQKLSEHEGNLQQYSKALVEKKKHILNNFKNNVYQVSLKQDADDVHRLLINLMEI